MKLNSFLEKTQQLKTRTKVKRSTLDRFKNIPFMCQYDSLECSDECFNHLIGLPVKDNNTIGKPIYQWQYDYIIKNLEEHKYNWIKKASGIGCTELILRWILYKCLVNNDWSGGIVVIVTGPNIDLSKRLIERLYNLIYNYFPNAKQNDYKLIVNDTEISAFPSNHVEAFRSLTNVRFVMLDEADFFRVGEQNEARVTSERYIAKSNVRIAMVSTPNLPGGLFERIEQEEPCLYNKVFIPYTVALGTIFTEEQIAEQKKSHSFEREYNLKYLGSIGTIFNIQEVEACITKYPLDEYITTSPYHVHYIGADPGYGKDSTFAIVVLMYIDDQMRIIHHEAHKNPIYNNMLHTLNQLIKKYNACKLFIDASASSIIHELLTQHGEHQAYERLRPEVLERFKYSSCKSPLIVPVAFNKDHLDMMKMTQSCISKGILKIHPKFEEVIIALKSAQNKVDNPYSLDKSRSAYHDSLDALRLALSCMKAR
jgi:hypothetical protein